MNSDPEPRSVINQRLNRLLIFVFVLIIIIFIFGLLGFRYLVKLNWIDSIHNTSFYLSGMGAIAEMKTPTEKLFSSAYAIIAGFVFIAIAAYLIDAIIDIVFFNNQL